MVSDQKIRAPPRRGVKSSVFSTACATASTVAWRSRVPVRTPQRGRALLDHALGRSLCYWRRFWSRERHWRAGSRTAKKWFPSPKTSIKLFRAMVRDTLDLMLATGVLARRGRAKLNHSQFFRPTPLGPSLGSLSGVVGR